MTFSMLLFALVVGCHGLRFQMSEPQYSNKKGDITEWKDASKGLEPAKKDAGEQLGQSPDSPQCPDVLKDTDNVLYWGMILDGKDHSQGKGAYNWHGFKDAFKALKFMLEKNPNEPLTFQHLMEARKLVAPMTTKTYKDSNGNSKTVHVLKDPAFSWAGQDPKAYEGPIFRSYTCLDCTHMKKMIDDVPENLWDIKNGTNALLANNEHACPGYKHVFLKPKSVSETKKLFKKYLDEYNADMEKLTEKTDQLDRLASFLKDYAFLHPWGNGNGRFRTLMLNHEVRRLGLGCGTFMYNNNKDLYFITKTLYRQKIEEGIEMYNKAMATGQSPWLDDAVVDEHKQRFAPDIAMPGLTKCRGTEFTKGSYWLEKVTEIPESQESDHLE